MEPETGSRTARVDLQGIVKNFPGVRALQGVDLDVRSGEIHALCGENGSGKSTLMGILGGAIRPDSGTMRLDGEIVRLRSPADALGLGIAVIHQESLDGRNALGCRESGPGTRAAPGNLAEPPIDEPAGRRAPGIARFSDRSASSDRPTDDGRAPASGDRAALGRQARVLVLDEPTAALTRAESARLFALLRPLRERGLAIVYISHHLDEIDHLADRISVLRDGRKVGTWNARDLPTPKLVAAMVGEVQERPRSARRAQGEPVLEVEKVSGKVLNAVSFTIRPGEIVGLTGLAGAGQEELARLAFGDAKPASGRILWSGRAARWKHPIDAIRAGIGSIPADRRAEGLVRNLGVGANLALAAWPRLSTSGWISQARWRALCEGSRSRFEIACSSLRQRVGTLSGGNQQKVLLARWAAMEPRLLILNDPTRGIDVRTREAIHRWIEDRAADGWAFLLVTSDMHELLRLSDRVLVLRSGKVVLDRPANEIDEANVVSAMMEDPNLQSEPE